MKVNILKAIIAVILLLLTVSVTLQIIIITKINNFHESCDDLCAPALPVSYLFNSPECTNNLLDSLNITNVQIKEVP